ncbi:MAG: UDP-N-acetylmuramate dehydrogenase [Spirochaetaceae bacterium]|nr:UDP-N-acetylmuramate dehydrogenase [Spirochaetaceae bacterium]
MTNICKLSRQNEPLAPHTTFKIGGNADYFFMPQSVEELLAVILRIKENNQPFFVLGGGSNVVINDEGFRGAVICTEKLNTIYIEEKSDIKTLVCGAGCLMNNVVAFCEQNSLSGLESFSGLPGTVGGACFMNARCYNKSISDVLVSAEYVDTRTGKKGSYKMNCKDWDYKKSPFQNTDRIIVQAVFCVKDGNKDEIKKQDEYFVHDREQKGHFRYPSAGSVFKNNRDFGEPSGKLIQDAGLLGYSIGGAKVSDWHGNFIINYNNATAADVKALVEHVRHVVYEKRGFLLEPEIIFK